MKLLIIVLSVILALVASEATTNSKEIHIENNAAFDYLTKVGIPLANRIREAELASNSDSKQPGIKPSLKIVNGVAARLGDIPYQAGLIIAANKDFSICSGSLLNAKRVLTAAHCWWDGKTQATSMTVVLGSTKLYSGGVRMETSEVKIHSQWEPVKSINDIAMVYLPNAVQFSKYISPIALPSGRELTESFLGETVYASGYGQTASSNPITLNAYLSFITLKVIDYENCKRNYQYFWATEICAYGGKTKTTCGGDSGGPLALRRNKKLILIGVYSFGRETCTLGVPTSYTRVTSYIDWIKNKL